MTANVEISGVTHRFGAFTALDSVNLTIDAGKFAVLLGPSGCGKTTLLSILGGFLTPSEGAVRIGGQDVTTLPPAKRPTTTMFQDYALFPHMTLGDNVGFGLRMRGVGRTERGDRAADLLRLVGLQDAFYKKPHELSGGQRQRVALARSLAVEPDVLLLDEPLGALDLKLRRQMQDELKAIQKRVGTTFIHVTHDQEEAMAIADAIIVMNEGRVQDSGDPESIYLRPKNMFTAAFMGEANFLNGVIADVTDDAIIVMTVFGNHTIPHASAISVDFSRTRAVSLCFRPEHVQMHLEADNQIVLGEMEIQDVSFFGTHHRCHFTSEALPDGTSVAAHLPQTLRVNPGDRLALGVKLEHAILLTRETE